MSIILNDGSSSEDEDLEPYLPILEANNPYVKAYIPNDKSFNQEHIIMPSAIATSVKITDCTNPIIIPEPTYTLAKNIQRDANFIKCICVFDFICNFIYLMYGFYYFIIISLVCYCGYNGAHTFNKRKIIYYLCYQYIQLLGKTCILVYILLLKFNKNIRNSYEERYPHSNIPYTLSYHIYYASLLLFFQFYFAKFVRKFYYNLPDKPIVVNYTIV
tara:strand:+ start:1551 stop:2198 length:648 start_codon:yes stop_codon:yes gene_type:complete